MNVFTFCSALDKGSPQNSSNNSFMYYLLDLIIFEHWMQANETEIEADTKLFMGIEGAKC